jgi:hypothetical protein
MLGRAVHDLSGVLMTDSKPASTLTNRHFSRRRLLAIGAAVPAAVVAAKALPGQPSAYAMPQAVPAADAAGAPFALADSPAPASPAYCFC